MSRVLVSVRLSGVLLSLAALVLFAGCPPAPTPPKPAKPAAKKSEPVKAIEPAPEGEKPAEGEAAKGEKPAEGEAPMVEKPAEGETPKAEKPAEAKPEKPAEAETPKAAEAPAEQPEPLAKAELLVELPDDCSTPDAMCMLPNGDVLLAVPNVNTWLKDLKEKGKDAKQDPPPKIVKITKDNKLEDYYVPPKHPVTGTAFPFGMCVDPEGKHLYVTDLQWFTDPAAESNNARVYRLGLDDKSNPVGEPEVIVEGLVVANAVVVRDGYLYVTDTYMVPKADPKDPKEPKVTGIVRVKLADAPVKMTLPLKDDPHVLATLKTFNAACDFGADGLTFDSKGNLYCGNFGDGTMHKIAAADLDKKGQEAAICAKVPFMKSCDGIFCDLRTDNIFIADSIANAVQVLKPDGQVVTLARDDENDGSGGRLDQPCEVLLRGNECIASNMDFPVPGGVNKTWDKPYTVSVIKLPESLLPKKE